MADRLTLCTNTYHTYSLEDSLAGAQKAGFTSVELTSVPGWTEHVRRDATDEELAHVKDLLQQYGQTAVSFAGHSDLASDSGVAEFRKALNVAQKLGIPYVTTSTGGHDASSHGSLDEQRDMFLARIRPLCDEAAEKGITICLETHGGLVANGAVSAELIKLIDKPNIGINYDPANVIYYGNTDPVEDIKVAAPYVRHMHAKDSIGGFGVWNFPPAGTGEVDFKAIFATLDAAGFDGPVSSEIEFQGEPWPALDDVHAAVKTAYDYLRGFVKN
ncbi:MAG: sugar phosphate isomerase/epimerase family protein [Thermomicrobiales bacterium]